MLTRTTYWFQSIGKLIAGDTNISFEHRFINTLTLCIAITTFIGSTVNFMLQLGPFETYITLGTSILFFILYSVSRILHKTEIVKWLAILLSLVLLSGLWLHGTGSKGPIPYSFFIVLLSIVLLTQGWARITLVVVLLLNFSLLFYLEGNTPFEGIVYESARARKIDMLSSILLYFILAFILMSYSIQNYLREKHQAEKSDRLKSSFLANMSHEIRTPMNAIVGFTTLLQNPNLPAEKSSYYSSLVEENVNYLLRLINDIMDVSMIEADELEVVRYSIQVNEFMQGLVTAHQQLIPENKNQSLHIKYNDPGKPLYAMIDPTRLEQILSNLLSNAIKFTPQGYITLGFEKSNRNLLFFVNDTGIGIPNEELESIFERFTKLEPKNNEILQRGTGIGLSIAQKIVELFEGEIWAESKIGEGSTFYFTLPYIKPENH